jgi:DNA/RNA endonuclease YhcR with UshA esterase domain
MFVEGEFVDVQGVSKGFQGLWNVTVLVVLVKQLTVNTTV